MGNNGGARPGAGRKKGERDIRTKRLQEVVKAGRDPFEVLLKKMNYHAARAEKGKDHETIEAAWDKASEAAVEALPYIRAKLKALEVTHRPMDLSKLTEADLAELERLIAAAAPARSNPGGEEATRH